LEEKDSDIHTISNANSSMVSSVYFILNHPSIYMGATCILDRNRSSIPLNPDLVSGIFHSLFTTFGFGFDDIKRGGLFDI